MAQVPRSLPRREPEPEPISELAARIEGSALPGQEPDADDTPPGSDDVADDESEAPEPVPAEGPEAESELADAPEIPGTPLEVPESPEPVMPTARLGRSAAGAAAEEDDDDDEPIELPTMIEPKAQRSPWAWAAPPEWNRDEDDGSSSGRTSKDA